MNSGFITQLEPSILLDHWENPDSEIMENGMEDILNESDIKDIDIVSHTLSEDLIKSEIISENILFVKTENVKIESIIESENLIKTEDTSDDNGQKVVEVKGNLKTDEQQVLNFSNDLNGISVRSPKYKHPKKTDFAAKIKVIEAPVIPVKSHEYITLAKNKHVCNHCQLICKKLNALKFHIRRKHREVTTMYLCRYCSFKSNWKPNVRLHIIRKHKGTRNNLKYHYCDKCDYNTYHTGHLKSHKLNHLKPEEIQYFYCYHCSFKTKRKDTVKTHILRHFKNEEIKFHCYICDFMTLKRNMIIKHLKKHFEHRTKTDEAKRKYKFENHTEIRYYYCDKCNYKGNSSSNLKTHKLNHLKPEEIQYFYCYHCAFKSKRKDCLKIHILRHFKNEEIKFHCYICDFMTRERNMIIKHLKKHFKHRTKSGEAECKDQLENHTKIRYHYCDKCDYRADKSSHLKSHKIIHLKPEEIEYFYCYHCSFKSKYKNSLKTHIFSHFKKGQIEFDCYICKFMTPNRESIVEHIKKHSKVQIKSEMNEGS